MNETPVKIRDKGRFPFPVMGQRIIKTAIAVFLCLLTYILRGYNGMVVQSAIAAIICMQPYTGDSKKSARNRVVGTLFGGVWGLGFLWLMAAFPVLSRNMVIVYAIMAVGTALVLYNAVLLKLTDSASLMAIVYLCVIISYPNVESPILQTFNRCFDTIIGVCVAVFVNTVHLPMKRHPEKLFFVRMEDLVEDRYSHVSSRVLIELNRLYDDGAQICLVSRWAPAYLMSQMGLLKINVPVIVMDGAALYDMAEKKYYEILEIDHEDADYLCQYLAERNLCAFIITLRDNNMFIYRKGQISAAEEADYELMKRSPYRNYIEGSYQEQDQITMIRFIVREEEADQTEAWIASDPRLTEKFRIIRRAQPRLDGYAGIYFYNKNASAELIEELLVSHMRQTREVEPVYVYPISRAYSPERDAPVLLGRIRKMYESPKWMEKGR